MLQRLFIQNYAIIEELDIRFTGNLNIITGETGAGKSILLGALSLILGERCGTGVLQDSQRKCVIEGSFLLPEKKDIRAFFQDNDLDMDAETIIRREVYPSGKSRAFINDIPVTLQVLSTLSGLLVDLHQQFDTLQLGYARFQLEVLDALAGNQGRLPAYQEMYSRYQAVTRSLEQMEAEMAQAAKDTDYNRFLHDEIAEAGFTDGEMEALEQELKTLSHAEELKRGLTEAVYGLEEGESPVVQQLGTIQTALEHLADIHAGLPPLLARLKSSLLDLQDLAGELRRINDRAEVDEERIVLIQERLDNGNRLLKKHGVHTTAELLALQEQLSAKLHQALHMDETIAAARKEQEELQKALRQEALRLSEARKGVSATFVKKVNQLLRQVGMPNAALHVEIQETSLQETGIDDISFLFDANKSGHFQPLRKVASGGELSRLMLCIKSLMAASVALPTLIFDEIDNGISGEAARQVGLIMKGLAKAHQVICITHQPQIAGKADTHFLVYKEKKGGRVHTGIRLLDLEERIDVIARMLSGENPSSAALANARELTTE